MSSPARASGPSIEAATDFYSKGRPQEAEQICLELLRANPNDPDALHVAGLAANALGRTAEGLALLERACRLRPGAAQYHYNLAVTYQQVGRDQEALLEYLHCLRIQPFHGDALWNSGEILRLQERFDMASAQFEWLLVHGRNYPGICHRLAVCYAFLGRARESQQMFEQELTTRPVDEALTFWELSHLLLAIGDYARGWRAYERRFDTPKSSVTCHDFKLPRWRGEPLAGRTVLVHGEQGLGDEIMFASILPDLLRRAAAEGGKVLLAVSPALVRSFAAAFPQARVLPHVQGMAPAQWSVADAPQVQLPIGSLATLFRNKREDFPGQPYLSADAARVAHYRKLITELAPASGRKLKVGLCWGTNPALHHQKAAVRASQKSIPVRQFVSLAATGIQFVSLQTLEQGPAAAQAPELDLLDLSAELTDFAETAALMKALDLVITVDTSVAHMAGALGVQTWVPLMKHCDWRWERERADCVWYPALRLFRQSTQGDWQPAIARMREALHKQAAGRA